MKRMVELVAPVSVLLIVSALDATLRPLMANVCAVEVDEGSGDGAAHYPRPHRGDGQRCPVTDRRLVQDRRSCLDGIASDGDR